MLENIVAEIDVEIARLNQVKALLMTSAMPAKRGPGRPAETIQQAAKPKKKRRLSTEAREKMRQAQLRRWAAIKKDAKKSSKE